MPGQWGNTDNASNSVIWGVVEGKLRANSVNQTSFFNNTTKSAFITNQIIGQFGVDATEIAVNQGPIVHITVTNNGSGYSSNTANGTFTAVLGGANSGQATSANAFGVANTTGRINSISVGYYGNNYIMNPTFTLPQPAAVTFNGNTAVATPYITTASAPYFLVGDKVVYAGNVTSTPVGLTDTATYYISFANATVVGLSTTSGGSTINITSAPYASTLAGGATIRGETATAVAVAGGSKGVAHSGWVVRKVGTGGRAGRVTYETLVAMGTMTGDGSDDLILPDA